MGLEPRAVYSTGPGTGEWSGVITDDETYRDVLELLADATLNGWAVSWLPGMPGQSVWVIGVTTEVKQTWIDVTTIGGLSANRIPGQRAWEILILLSWENPHATP